MLTQDENKSPQLAQEIEAPRKRLFKVEIKVPHAGDQSMYVSVLWRVTCCGAQTERSLTQT
jgi:hypothetical protein